MRVFYSTIDHGDGSSGVGFYESQECIDLLEDHDPERYGCGEGGSSFWVEGTISVKIKTLEEVKAEIADNDSWDEE